MESPLTPAALLGYVSINYTEANNIKVILIADEQELIKSQVEEIQQKYNVIKEKTIWQTIEYSLNYEECYDDLITSYRLQTQALLTREKAFLIEKFRQYKIENLRWVKYFFYMVDILATKMPEDFFAPYEKLILNTTLIISAEYKQGKLTNKINDEAPEYIKTTVSSMIGWGLFPTVDTKENDSDDGNNESTSEDSSRFANRYPSVTEGEYYFFEGLYKLVCFGYLDEELLATELEQYKASLDRREECHIILDELKRIVFLEEAKFEEKWNTVIQYLNENRYMLYDLKRIANLYESHAQDGIIFPSDKADLYALLENQYENCNGFNPIRSGNFYEIKEIYLNGSEEFRGLIDKIDKKISTIQDQSFEEAVEGSLTKLINSEVIKALELKDIFVHGNLKHMSDLAASVAESVTKFDHFRNVFSRGIDDIKHFGRNSDTAKNNLEHFTTTLIDKVADKNILKWNVAHFMKSIDRRII